MQPVYLAIAAALVIVVGIICFVLGSVYRKAKAERELGSAEAEAKRILTDAMKNAEAKFCLSVHVMKRVLIRSRRS